MDDSEKIDLNDPKYKLVDVTVKMPQWVLKDYENWLKHYNKTYAPVAGKPEALDTYLGTVLKNVLDCMENGHL